MSAPTSMGTGPSSTCRRPPTATATSAHLVGFAWQHRFRGSAAMFVMTRHPASAEAPPRPIGTMNFMCSPSQNTLRCSYAVSSGLGKIFCLCCRGFRADQNLVELAGDVALEAADDLFLGQAFGGASLHVVTGATAGCHAGQGDHVEGAVGLSVAAPFEPRAVSS